MAQIPRRVLTTLGATTVLAMPAVAAGQTAGGSPAIPTSTVVVGALPAPPAGPGPGKIAIWQPRTNTVREVSFAAPGTLEGSSFFVAPDRATGSLFIPTEAGKTIVVSTRSGKVEGSFSSPAGSRVARTTPNGRIVLIESGAQLVADETSAPYRTLFTDSVGGNALVISPNGKDAFVGGNADSVVTEIALPSGKVVQTFPVAHSGDMIWARGDIFSADMANGVVSVILPRTGQVKSITTPEVDPNFSYSAVAAATAGFMQLAVSPNQKTVYAAGFSGHILKFSTARDAYLGEIKVTANPATPNKLSGLDVLPGGHLAVVTVENLDMSAVVSLMTGKVLTSTSGLAANRWISFTGSAPIVASPGRPSGSPHGQQAGATNRGGSGGNGMALAPPA